MRRALQARQLSVPVDGVGGLTWNTLTAKWSRAQANASSNAPGRGQHSSSAYCCLSHTHTHTLTHCISWQTDWWQIL